MIYCPEYCIEAPDDFPITELTQFMATARHVLLDSGKARESAWKEFAGASNLIGWRFRASSEDWLYYKNSWEMYGAAVDHEGKYRRERALFGMFTAGVACVESTTYALAALASHSKVFAMPFGIKEQRACSPKRLAKWLASNPKASSLVETLKSLHHSSEWNL